MQNTTKTVEKNVSKNFEFDFDEWMTLNQNDPEAFERRRQELIEATIQAAPEEQQRRLKGVMFQVEMERRKAATPLDACMKVSSMMWEKFDEMRVNLNALANPEALAEEQLKQAEQLAKKADIIAFGAK